jgi:hypothetical protein
MSLQTLPSSGDRSVGVVRVRITSHGVSMYVSTVQLRVFLVHSFQWSGEGV